MATVRAISSGAFAPLDLSRLSSHLVRNPSTKPMAKPPASYLCFDLACMAMICP